MTGRGSAKATAKAPPSKARSERRRRRRTAEQSRAALIAATQSLMARGEPLTTVSVTAEAGLAQPTFYAYFTGIEPCRVAAVEHAIARLTDFDAERRAQQLRAETDVQAQVDIMARWLEAAPRHRDIRSIYDRYRDEDSSVGALLRAMGKAHLARVTEDLWRIAAERGVGVEHHREFRLLALALTDAVSAVARAVGNGDVRDIQAAARMLVRNNMACIAATMEACIQNST